MEAGEILLKRGLLNQEQLEKTRVAVGDGTRADQVAVQLGFVSEEEALKALGTEVGLDFIDLTTTKVDLSLLKGFPQKLIHRHTLFPISRENGSLVVATSDPFDLYPPDELTATTGLWVVPVLASREQILKQSKSHLGGGSATI